MKYHSSLAAWAQFLSLDRSPEKVEYGLAGRMGDVGSHAGRLSVSFGVMICVGSACSVVGSEELFLGNGLS